MTDMRRYIALLLALVMAFALAACSFSTDRPPESAPPATEAPAPESAAAENDLCRVLLAAPEENDAGYDFAVTLENRTDAPLTFLVEAKGFNGFYLFGESFGLFEVVEGGETRNVDFTVDKAALARYAIDRMDSASVAIRAFSEDNPEAMNGELRMVLDPDAPATARMTLEDEQTLVSSGGFTVTVGNAHADENGGCVAMLWCENAADADVQLTLEHVRCDGQDTHAFSGFTIPAGGKGYGRLRVDGDTLQTLGLAAENVRELSFDLALEDAAGQTLAEAQDVNCAVK